MEIYYNRLHKALGIEGTVSVIVPLKIAKRIAMLKRELRRRRGK